MKPKRLVGAITYTIENFDALVCVVLGIAGATISAIYSKSELAIAALGAATSLIAFTVLKDRAGRQKLSAEIARLNPLSADEVLRASVDERAMIESAAEELVFVQETGGLIAESCRDLVHDFLARGGKVRWIVAQSDPAIVDFLAFRNADLNAAAMAGRMSHSERMIGVIPGGDPLLMDRMAIRHIRYPVEFTGTFKDPNHKDLTERQAALRLQGFRLTFHRKPCLQLNYSNAARTFSTFSHQAEAMWNSATKCIFISSKPREGKTTAIERLVAYAKKKGIGIYGVIAKEVLGKNGERIGFEAHALRSGSSSIIANKNVDSYDLDHAKFSEVVLKELSSVPPDTDSILILDEFGPIQMQDPNFAEHVSRLLENTRLTIFGTVAEACIAELRHLDHGFRAEIWRFDRPHQQGVVEALIAELRGLNQKDRISPP